MKFLIVFAGLAAIAAAQQAQQQRQPPIAVLRQSQDLHAEGSYTYNYETENGISASEDGVPRVEGEEGLSIAATGQFQYTAPDGTPIQVQYTADENGFQPQGAHLHPIPEAIRRALEHNAAHPEEDSLI